MSLGIVLIVFILVIAVAVLGYFYQNLKEQLNQQVGQNQRMLQEQQQAVQQQQQLAQQQQQSLQEQYRSVREQYEILQKQYQLEQEQSRVWREQLTEKLNAEAQEQYRIWREKEIETIRTEQREIVMKEASAYVEAYKSQLILKAQEQFQVWRDTSFESMRSEQKELAIREANTKLEQWKFDEEQTIRQSAISKSASVIMGKVTEHFIPYLPEFKFNPKDARFLGSPVDFIVFDGMDEGEVRMVVFVEIKTGSSGLTKRERQIRDAVQAGKVEWVTLKASASLQRSLRGEDEGDILELELE